jgi:hypothetical protein
VVEFMRGLSAMRFRATIGRSVLAIAVGVGGYGLLLWAASNVDIDHGSMLELAFPSGVVQSLATSLLGLLVWLALHFAGHRHWRTAVLLGALLSFVAALGTNTYWFTLPLGVQGFGWSFAMQAALLAALLGALVAGAMWHAAYRHIQ